MLIRYISPRQLGIDGGQSVEHSKMEKIAADPPASPDFHVEIARQLEVETERLARHLEKKKVFDKMSIPDTVYGCSGT